MKRLALIVTAALLSMLFYGCGSLVYKTEIDTDMVSVKDDMEAQELAEQLQTDTYEETVVKVAYAEALENMIINRIFPDGRAVETFNEDDSLENNEFAVCDVDADGMDELIIRFSDTFMAGMVEMVYGYDSGTDSLMKEVSQFPALTYYDNGTMTAPISHNQGKAGRFWPYTAYKHNAETDTYEKVMFIDAWDGKIFEDGFPTEADTDGDLLVYFINPDYDNGYYSNPIDGDEYYKWSDEFFGEKIEVLFAKLTMENISLLK